MSASAVIPGVHARLDPRESARLANDAEGEKLRSLAAVDGGLAFYRKHTESLLRRYLRMSFDIGRCPSVLGNLTFRGKSSHSNARNFEDAVIFVHDIDTCLKKLDPAGRELVGRIALQDYTQYQVAMISGTSVRSVMRRYGEALDRLTEILLEVDLLEAVRY